MSATAKLYDLSAVLANLGTIVIGGFGEEGGLSFEHAADIGEVIVGATGETVFSRNNNKDMFCDVTLLETSKSYRDVAALMTLQINLPYTLLPLPFLMRDLANGDLIACAGAVFVTRPNINKAKKVGERVFRLWLPNGAARALYGFNNTL